MMEFVNGFRMTTHINEMENDPFMFETTNQYEQFWDGFTTDPTWRVHQGLLSLLIGFAYQISYLVGGFFAYPSE